MDTELRYEGRKYERKQRRMERPTWRDLRSRGMQLHNATASILCCTQSWIGIECDPSVWNRAHLTGDRFRPIRSMELILVPEENDTCPRYLLKRSKFLWMWIFLRLNEFFLLNMANLNNIKYTYIDVKYNIDECRLISYCIFVYMYVFYICNKHSYSKHI